MITITIKIKGDRRKVVMVTAAIKRSGKVTQQEERAETVLHAAYDLANEYLGDLCGNRIHIPTGNVSKSQEKKMRKLAADRHEGRNRG